MTASLCGPLCGGRLFLHVLGATLLFGGVLTVTTLAWAARRNAAHTVLLRRVAFRTLLLVVWPAFILMRVGAQLVLSGEGLDDSKATWIGVGFGVSDVGILVLLLMTLFGWLANRRPWAATAFASLASLYLAALGVAWFFMSAKP